MVLEKFKGSRRASEAGSTLIEVLVATTILLTGILSMMQMFTMSTATNLSARTNTFVTVLAEQKIEQLRGLTWGFDVQGLPVSDFATDTAVAPETPSGGTGLQPSPASALQRNTAGYVDYVALDGTIVGRDETPPADGVYTRRWSIEPLPTNPNNTLIIQVLVTRVRDRGQADSGNVRRLMDEARIVTVKTRKAQ